MNTLQLFINRLLHIKAFRYLMAAGTATLVDVGMYFIAVNFIFKKTDVIFSNGFVLSYQIAALIFSFTCGLATNFVITKYFVFTDSSLKTRVQFFRFVVVAFGTFVVNYFFMRFLVFYLGLFPTISRLISAVSVGVLSFITHKAFSFKVGNKNLIEEEEESLTV